MKPTIAILFDMDGVLIDSEPAWQAAEIRVLSALGVPLDSQMAETTTGWRIDRVVNHWRALYPFEGDTGAIATRITAEVARHVRTHGEPLPGACDLVRACHAQGMATGLATSSSYPLIHAVLDRLDLREFFHALASASEVPRGKPDPAVYQLCARRLGLQPHQCVAIEDSCTGIQSAVAAGMRCLAVDDGLTPRESAIEVGAHAWTPSLCSIAPATLVSLAHSST